jgi:hypothetical protein
MSLMPFLLVLAVAFVVYALVKHYGSAEGATKWDKFVAALMAAGAAIWGAVSGWFGSLFGG